MTSAALGNVPEFDALRPREQAVARRNAERWLKRFSRERPDMTDDNRRRAISMGLLACASYWASICGLVALPVSILWSVPFALHLYWLLVLPALLTIVVLFPLTLSVRRYRMMRRYYPEKFKTASKWQRFVEGPA
jgi:hypothetical protein